jgi:hypothetical protein
MVSVFRIGLTIAFCGLLLLPVASQEQKKEAAGVQDEANLFGKDAINQATEIIAKIREKHRKDLRIDTVEKLPDTVTSVEAWAAERAKKSGMDGVYVVITKQPKRLEVLANEKTRTSGLFTQENRDQLAKILKSELGKTPDEALIKAANYTLEAMNKNAPSRKVAARPIKDDASFFSKDALEEANAFITKIKDKHGKDLYIETRKEGPSRAAAAKWAADRYNELGLDGVYIMISEEPKHFQIEFGKKTQQQGLFSQDNVKDLIKILGSNLATSKDEALRKTVKYVAETMDERAQKAKPATKDAAKSMPPN